MKLSRADPVRYIGMGACTHYGGLCQGYEREPHFSASLIFDDGPDGRVRSLCPACRLAAVPIDPELDLVIQNRDGFRCRYCGVRNCSERLVVDRVDPQDVFIDHDPQNLITVCARCFGDLGDYRQTVGDYCGGYDHSDHDASDLTLGLDPTGEYEYDPLCRTCRARKNATATR